MSDLSIDEAITKIAGMKEKIAETAVEIMREEAPYKTGALVNSIHAEINGSTIFVGTDIEHAKYVVSGRKEVVPSWKKHGQREHPYSLHWNEYGDVFAMRSSPVPPNDFVGRTRDRLESMSFTL